jgi:glycosyltransferase involved in cell wall biosynthesis
MMDSRGRRRVLVIAHYFPPLAMGGVQRIAKFCKYLPDYGWEPLVVTSVPGSYFARDSSMNRELEGIRVFRSKSLVPMAVGMGESYETWRRRLKRLGAWVLLPDVRVLWSPGALLVGQGVLSRYSVDCILATAPPYSSLLAARLLSIKSGLPLAVDLRDAWVDDPFASFPTTLHRALAVLLERFVVSGSAKVISINQQIVNGLQKRHDLDWTRFQVVNQGFDPEDFEQKVEQTSRFTICYAGSLVRTRRPDDLFRAISDLVSEKKIDRMLLEVDMVGFCPQVYKRSAERLGVDDVVKFRGYLPHRDSVRHLLRANVLWLYVDASEGETVLTGKLAEYIGSGRMVIASVPERGAAASLVRDTGAGLVVRPGDVEGLKGALMVAYSKWRAREELLGARHNVGNYDRRRLAGELADILTQISRAGR